GIAMYWDTKGAALAGLGRHDEAIQCYDKAIELDRNKGAAWWHKGESLKALDRSAEAESFFDTGRKLGFTG
ncbi:MAG: tetratricopeptide repeat protein, partial [Methanosarcinales archaeon]|nr:tetratricopeptide repeat protein [Methanosarcinales archaeon]